MDFDAHLPEDATPPNPPPKTEGKKPRGRNWSTNESVQLITAYKEVLATGGERGESSEHFNERVYAKFKDDYPSTERSLKACTDKLASLKDMFKFIRDFECSRIPGSTGKGPWWELSKTDKMEFLRKYRKTDISQEVYKTLGPVLDGKPTTDPEYLIESPGPSTENPYIKKRHSVESDDTETDSKFNSGKRKKKRRASSCDEIGTDKDQMLERMSTFMEMMVKSQQDTSTMIASCLERLCQSKKKKKRKSRRNTKGGKEEKEVTSSSDESSD